MLKTFQDEQKPLHYVPPGALAYARIKVFTIARAGLDTEFHGLGRRYHAGTDLLAWCEQMEIKPPPDEELASVLRPAFDRNSPYLMGAAYTDW